MSPRAGTAPDEPLAYPPFRGFPREGMEFLRKLKRNNNRPWFTAHREEYEELVRFPMHCLIASLRARMADEAADLTMHPVKSVFRVHRDVRFSRDKRPYKTNIAASFHWKDRRKGTEAPGLYVGIEPDEVFIGGGLYMPDGSQLKSIRRAIADAPEEYLEIVRAKGFVRKFGGIQGERLQRAPLGYPPDHPMIEHLKHKQFFVGVESGHSPVLQPAFLTTVVSVFRETLPLVRWLARVTR